MENQPDKSSTRKVFATPKSVDQNRGMFLQQTTVIAYPDRRPPGPKIISVEPYDPANPGFNRENVPRADLRSIKKPAIPRKPLVPISNQLISEARAQEARIEKSKETLLKDAYKEFNPREIERYLREFTPGPPPLIGRFSPEPEDLQDPHPNVKFLRDLDKETLRNQHKKVRFLAKDDQFHLWNVAAGRGKLSITLK